MVVQEAPERIKDLIELGVSFDRKQMEHMILQRREAIQNTGYFIIKTIQEKQFRRP